MSDAALDGAMFSIWLHGDWYALTRPMTTEEKEAAGAAVLRHHQVLRASEGSDPCDNPCDPRWMFWWRDEYRYNGHGVDTWRIGPGAEVVVEHEKLTRRPAVVYRKDNAHMVVVIDRDGDPHLLRTDNVVEVSRGPYDVVLARLDAHAAKERGRTPDSDGDQLAAVSNDDPTTAHSRT